MQTIRLLLLSGRSPDFQTGRATTALTRLRDRISVSPLRIGTEARDRLTLAKKLRARANEFDIIHAHGLDALTIAAMIGFGQLVFTPIGFPSKREIGWLRAVSVYRDVQVVCPTTTHYRAFASRGVPADRCHVIRPGVDFSTVRGRRDDALRARLGFTPDDYVVLAVGESTTAAAHDRAAWACGILHKLDARVKFLVWGVGARGVSAAVFGRNIGNPKLATVATQQLGHDVSFESLLPAADCALVTARGPVPTLPIAMTMAAGLPIVSTVTYTVAELLEDRHTALMVTSPAPREIARRVNDVRNDANLRWSIADKARAEAYEHFSLTRFLDEHRNLYKQIASGSFSSVLRGEG